MVIEVELTTGRRELRLPVRVVSDWHLGHPVSKVATMDVVEHLLDGVGTLVMAGDGREELVKSWRSRSDELWEELQVLCKERGVDFVALAGNHDPRASAEGWLYLEDGKTLVTHGHMFYDSASPWSRELFENLDRVKELLERHCPESLMERWKNTQEVGEILRPEKTDDGNALTYVKKAFWPPERLYEVVKTWGGFAGEGVRFLERFCPEVETVVCGHFHRRGQFVKNGRRVLNTGSMMRLSHAAVVDYDGERLMWMAI